MTPEDIKALEKNITTIPYAQCGTWSNPPTGKPGFSAQLVAMEKDTEKLLPGVIDNLDIPFQEKELIDPSGVGSSLPPITHDQFYIYFKTLVLSAMVAKNKALAAATKEVQS